MMGLLNWTIGTYLMIVNRNMSWLLNQIFLTWNFISGRLKLAGSIRMIKSCLIRSIANGTIWLSIRLMPNELRSVPDILTN